MHAFHTHQSNSPEITQLLLEWSDGGRQALDQLIPLVDKELHRLAHHYMAEEASGHVLQTTALVNEAYLRLIDSSRVRWQNRAHFFAVSAQLMRRILVDLARAKKKLKRGGDVVHISLQDSGDFSHAAHPDLIALDDALDRLSAMDARKGRIVELRYFGGLSVKEAAEVLKVSAVTVMRDWSFAKVWLLKELEKT